MKKYYGLFERIKNNYPGSIMEYPLYYKEAADLYDQISIAYDDYPVFLKQAALSGGPILELCCGSGRLTLPLLKAGFEITAVDLSDDMLSNLQSQLGKKKYQRYRDNLTLVAADMTRLGLKENYNLIIIGATSIRLMEDDFTTFFNKMYKLLNTGGSFFFNFEDLPIRTDENELEEPFCVADLKDKDGNLSLVCMQRIINYPEERAVVNFIKISPGIDSKILLSRTDYRIFGVEDIRSAAEKSAFGSCEIFPAANSIEFFCRMTKS